MRRYLISLLFIPFLLASVNENPQAVADPVYVYSPWTYVGTDLVDAGPLAMAYLDEGFVLQDPIIVDTEMQLVAELWTSPQMGVAWIVQAGQTIVGVVFVFDDEETALRFMQSVPDTVDTFVDGEALMWFAEVEK